MSEQKLHGVNLGGWLVLEKWMTPSLFKHTNAYDEYTFMNTPNAHEKLRQHRDTFITETDFKWLSENGINAVRIPVGYWLIEEDDLLVSGISYLDWAMRMAEKYGINVVIDLHGSRGSQNGKDHSGRQGRAAWMKNREYRNQTISTLEKIAERYKTSPAFWGLQIINEPKFGVLHIKIRIFYAQAYRRLAQILHPHTRIIFSDAFTPRMMSGALAKEGIKNHPIMDIHIYHMATLGARYRSVTWFMKKTATRQRMLKHLARTQGLIIGEWSGVMSHETMRHIPAKLHDRIFTQHVETQLEAFKPAEGWFYWSYKTEEANYWNFRSQVECGNIKRNW